MSKRFLLKTIGVAMAAALVSACGGNDDPDIVELAQDRGGFSALLAAAQKAGLAEALGDDSASLTVFAPTDAAFGALATQLGFADATAMVAALPPSALASILSYHVLPSEKKAAALVAGGATQATIYTFDGSAATLALDTSSSVKITDAALTSATVTTADLDARNGVIHAIDKVLVPPGVLNVVQMAQVNPAFSSLVGAVTQAGLAGALSGAGPFTVFAPVNDAFAAIAGVAAGLTVPQLQTVLTYHVVAGSVLSSAIPFGAPITTVAGQPITITAGTAPTIATITDTTATPAKIVAVDVRASNGVIHVIDKVLLPNLGS
jgi:transforming growth factor-beta-induced protein